MEDYASQEPFPIVGDVPGVASAWGAFERRSGTTCSIPRVFSRPDTSGRRYGFVLIPDAGGGRRGGLQSSDSVPGAAAHDAIAVDRPGQDDTAGLSPTPNWVVDAIGARPGVLVAGSLGGFTAPLVCERVPARELCW
jgi:hypothetical protein